MPTIIKGIFSGGGKIRDATAVPSDVASGKVFYNNNGRQVGDNSFNKIFPSNIKEYTLNFKKDVYYKNTIALTPTIALKSTSGICVTDFTGYGTQGHFNADKYYSKFALSGELIGIGVNDVKSIITYDLVTDGFCISDKTNYSTNKICFYHNKTDGYVYVIFKCGEYQSSPNDSIKFGFDMNVTLYYV